MHRKTNIGELGLILGLIGFVAFAWFAFDTIVSKPAEDADQWAAALQAAGVIVGIGIAIFVPAWQHLKEEQGRQQDRRIFAVAYGMQLLPKLRELKRSLRWSVRNLGKQLDLHEANPEAGKYVHLSDSGDTFDLISYVRDSWQNIAQLDSDTVRCIVKAEASYAAAMRISDPEYSEWQEDEAGEHFHPTFDTVGEARDYVRQKADAMAEIITAITNIEGYSASSIAL